MEGYLTDEQKEIVKKYIDDCPIKAVLSFDWKNSSVKYNDEIKLNTNVKEIRGDEEIVRSYLLTKLVNELGYNLRDIEIERVYTAGRPDTITSKIDIIVHDYEQNDFLFIELKSPHDYNALPTDKYIDEQLFKVSAMAEQDGINVRYLVYYTCSISDAGIKDDCIIIDKNKYKLFSDWNAERNSTDELPANYGIAKKTAYAKNTEKDLETQFSHEILNKLQTDLHNVLWGGGSTDDNEIFASLTNLILTKIEDEYSTEDNQEYGFQCLVFDDGSGNERYESNEELFDRINKIYRRALSNRLNITDEDTLNRSYVIERNKFSLNKLRYTVQQLEKYSFVDGKNSVSGRDILGDFFESIVRTGFKQDKGQFFTPINVVKFMLWGLQTDKLAIDKINSEQEIPYLVDCSAGSGSFLIEYMKFITENVNYRYKNSLSTSRSVQDKLSEWFPSKDKENTWARTFVYGTEINFNLGTAIKVNMILHGDGSANVFVGEQKGDGLIPFQLYKKNGGVNELDKHYASDLYFGKEVNEHFDLILTNPPFSVDLDDATKKSLSENYMFGNKDSSENLFIERYYQLLKPKGRLAAILPESIFDTTDNRYIRLFLYKYFNIKAVVSLPQLTFEPYTSTKTSILFAQKKTENDVIAYNAEWDKYSAEWLRLSQQVQEIMDVALDSKNKKTFRILDLSEDDYKNILIEFLQDKFNQNDAQLSYSDIVKKYQSQLEDYIKADTDSPEYYGKINTGWVFKKVSTILNYDITMCEVEQIGFKRTVRGLKETENELYRTDKDGHVLVDDGIEETALDYLREIRWE